MSDSPAWGEGLETTTIAGRSYRQYRDRRRHVADFLDDAERWGERDYLVQGDRRISFGSFVATVRAAADRLGERGVAPGDRVMLLAANSPDWVITFFAILDAGAQVVLGNAWWSPAEAEHALKVATPALVVADAKRATLIPAGLPVCRPADLGGVTVPPPAPGPRLRAGRDEADPAVILFTSGTTGAPKGAVLSHRAVVGNIHNLLMATKRLPSRLGPDHPGTVSLLGVPLFHVGGMQTILNALLTGGTLIFLAGRFDPGEVLRLIETERVMVWGAVPTMVSRVLDHPDLATRDTSSLRSLTLGGSFVPPELLDRVRRAFPTARRRTGTVYGMTETGGALTAVVGDDMEQRPGTVGRALPTVDLCIADPDADGIGEIIAFAPTLMDGYLGVPDDPIIDADGWLHTGDLGRVDDDGYLYVLGRSKDIVIRGGENVACPHVESVLGTHPAVQTAAVVGLPHPDFGEEVAAAVVLRPGADVTEIELSAHARQHLGYFQVPTRWWIRREPLPTNATGKILKQALRDDWP